MDLRRGEDGADGREPGAASAGVGEPERNRSLLEELYRQHKTTMVRMLRRHAGSREDAENLFHEACRVTAERLSENRIADPSRLAGFIYGTARRMARSDRYKGSRSRTEGGDEVLASVASDPRDAPDASSQRTQLASVVRELLTELPRERDRRLLVLLYIEERDKEDICAELDLTNEHFSRVLLRAKQRLRAILARYGLTVEQLFALLLAVGVALGLCPAAQ